jgi:hypothetical protein
MHEELEGGAGLSRKGLASETESWREERRRVEKPPSGSRGFWARAGRFRSRVVYATTGTP